MKKIDLIHTTILIVAILAGYAAIRHILYLLSSLTKSNSYYRDGSDRLVYYFIMIIGFLMACIILVKNGRKYAEMMLKGEPEAFLEETPQWNLDRRNILLVLFIGMGVHTIIESTPYLIVNLYDLFRGKISSKLLESSDTASSTLALEVLRLTIGACLIYAAPALTNFIDKTIAVRLDADDSKT